MVVVFRRSRHLTHEKILQRQEYLLLTCLHSLRSADTTERYGESIASTAEYGVVLGASYSGGVVGVNALVHLVALHFLPLEADGFPEDGCNGPTPPASAEDTCNALVSFPW